MRIARLFNIAGLLRTVLVIIILSISGIYCTQAQTSTPEVLDTATLQQQLDYMEERMNIYNGYRAVRDDIFLKMNKNSLDSLNAAKREISRLEASLATTQSDMAVLQENLQQTSEDRDLAIKNKNSLSFLGIQMNKAFYNSIMWIIIIALVVLLILLFLMFKRSFVVTRQTTKDLEETKGEFESYRQQSRERYEKLVVQHHQEVLKLKGRQPRSIE
jgi:preprotein translocase subunit SecF